MHLICRRPGNTAHNREACICCSSIAGSGAAPAGLRAASTPEARAATSSGGRQNGTIELEQLAEVPAWIIDELKPKPAVAHVSAGISISRMFPGGTIEDRMRGILGRVVTATPNCDRNNLTFWAACTIRDMVVEGALDGKDARDAFDALGAVSRSIGLADREISARSPAR